MHKAVPLNHVCRCYMHVQCCYIRQLAANGIITMVGMQAILYSGTLALCFSLADIMALATSLYCPSSCWWHYAQ